MATKDEILRAVAAERRNVIAYFRTLTDEQFDTEVVPRWRVREVAAHFITLDISALTGPLLPVAFRHGRERLERWNDRQVPKWANRPIPELLVGLDRWGARFRALARAVPAVLYRTTMPTLWGRGPGSLLIWSRAFDEWVHRQDVRRAFGQPDEEVDLALVAEFVLTAAVSETLPQIERSSGTIAVSLDATPVPEWRYDLRAGTGAFVAADGHDAAPADVTVSVPAHRFVMAAARRDRFEDLLADGTARLEGDEGLGREFLGKLWIV